MENEYNPKSVTHPGIELQELLILYNIDNATFSELIAIPIKTLNSILNGESPITKEIALKLSEQLGVPSNYWVKRQELFDSSVVKIEPIGSDVESELGIKYRNYSVEIPGWKVVSTVKMSKAFVNKLKEIFVEAGYKIQN